MQWPLGFAHAPYDPTWAAWYPKRAAWMALAGPAANLVLGAIAFAIMKTGLSLGAFEIVLDSSGTFPWAEIVRGTGSPVAHSLAIFSSLLLVQNLLLFIFNLFPVPPMDGSAALPLIVPEGPMRKVRALFAEPWAPLLGLIVAWNLFPKVFYPAFLSVIRLLHS